MKLTSKAFQDNEKIPEKYTCDGEDISPPLELSEIPEGTKTLALIVDDQDSPGKIFVHWVIWNIPPLNSVIPENTVPSKAIEGTTDFGKTGWGGPCPPSGTHRYRFKLYALDTTLNLGPGTRKADLEKAMQGHILSQTELTGKYSRS